MMRRWLALGIATALLSGCAGWSTWDRNMARRNAVPAPAPQRALGPHEYLVRRGDTVYSIAFRHNLDFRDLARWNRIGQDYLIHPGEILRLRPPPVASVPSQRHATGEIRSRSMEDARPVPPRPAGTLRTAREADAAAVSAGQYHWVWPTAGVVTRGYDQDGNRGLDFSGKDGQTIVAAAPGKVVYSGNALKGYGELIIIKHDDQYLSAYGYNRSRKVKEGDVVRAGQPIADMGRGPENRPLLHFEIRKSGKPINPVGKLPAKAASRSG